MTLLEAVQADIETAARRLATLREIERLTVELDGGGGSANGDSPPGVGQQAATPAAGAPPAPPAARPSKPATRKPTKPRAQTGGRRLPTVDELAPRVLEAVVANGPCTMSTVRDRLGMAQTVNVHKRLNDTFDRLARDGKVEHAGQFKGGKLWSSSGGAQRPAAPSHGRRWPRPASTTSSNANGEQRAQSAAVAPRSTPQQRLVTALEQQPMTIQELAAAFDVHPADIATITSQLERRDEIQKGPGGKWWVIR